jgi:hypothetical protein
VYFEDEVHLLYICVPPSTEQTPPYESEVWQRIAREHRRVVELLTSLDAKMLERHIVLTFLNGGKRMNTKQMAAHDKELDRIFFAAMLQKLIAEGNVAEVAAQFQVTRGSVQSLQMQAAAFAGQSARFCEASGSRTLGRALNTFIERLNFGVKNELLPLMRLPSCNRIAARLLVKNRITGRLELAELTPETVAGFFAQKRGDDKPFQNEIDLAEKLLQEASMVASSLTIIEDLENSAITSTIGEVFARKHRSTDIITLF